MQLLRAKVPFTPEFYNDLLTTVCQGSSGDSVGFGRPPPIAYHIMKQGMDDQVWAAAHGNEGKPLHITEDGQAIVDLAPYNNHAALAVALHYWLRCLAEQSGVARRGGGTSTSSSPSSMCEFMSALRLVEVS